jgi:hypothetical protein
MKTVNLIFSRMGRSVIPLGMEGEHGVTTVRFDLSEELEHRPNASVTIKATSAAEADPLLGPYLLRGVT